MLSIGSRKRLLSSPGRLTKLATALAFSTGFLVFYSSQYSSQANTVQTARNNNTPTRSQKDAAMGLDHFIAHCASCHGETGKADTEKGKGLGAADLTTREVQSKSDAQLAGIISKGIPGTAMPPFGKTHSAAEIRQTVHGLPLPEFGHRVKFGNDPKKHIEFSAVTHVAKGKGIPPFLILHVAGHPDVTAQARRLGDVLKKAEVPVQVFGARETTHTKLNADLGIPDDPATKELFSFLDPLVRASP